MSDQPPRPNESPILHLDNNRRTGDRTWVIRIPAGFRASYACETETFRAIRKAAVKEREYWQSEKKSAQQNRDAARWAKEQERLWLQRERAAGLLVGWTDGHTPQELETYYWPVELAPALGWAISEAA